MPGSDHWVWVEQEAVLRFIPILDGLAPASDVVAWIANQLRSGDRGIELKWFDKLVGEIAVIYRFMNSMTVSSLLPDAPDTETVFNLLQEITIILNQANFEAGSQAAHEMRDRWEEQDRMERMAMESMPVY